MDGLPGGPISARPTPGVSLTWNPSTQDINIEEQPTPVAVLVTTANLQVTFNF